MYDMSLVALSAAILAIVPQSEFSLHSFWPTFSIWELGTPYNYMEIIKPIGGEYIFKQLISEVSYQEQ